MKLDALLELVGDEPLFESSLLLAGQCEPADLARQLTRWTERRVLLQLRRGLYCLAPPYRRSTPHPFTVANALMRASYVSLQSALAHWQLIPEAAQVVTSVTTRRPCRFDTPLGRFVFRHVTERLFWGYRTLEPAAGQQAFVASSEKALLDLIHLEPGAASPAFLEALRLQNLESLDGDELARLAERAGGSKLRRAADLLAGLRQAQSEEFETL